MAKMVRTPMMNVEMGNYNFRSASFITKAASIGVLGAILAFFNFVPPGTVF